MNNNKKSFAARAKELVGKYKRHKFDPVEKAELQSALAQLAQEQEAYKAANGLGNMPITDNAQGRQQFGYGTDSFGNIISNAMDWVSNAADVVEHPFEAKVRYADAFPNTSKVTQAFIGSENPDAMIYPSDYTQDGLLKKVTAGAAPVPGMTYSNINKAKNVAQGIQNMRKINQASQLNQGAKNVLAGSKKVTQSAKNATLLNELSKAKSGVQIPENLVGTLTFGKNGEIIDKVKNISGTVVPTIKNGITSTGNVIRNAGNAVKNSSKALLANKPSMPGSDSFNNFLTATGNVVNTPQGRALLSASGAALALYPMIDDIINSGSQPNTTKVNNPVTGNPVVSVKSNTAPVTKSGNTNSINVVNNMRNPTPTNNSPVTTSVPKVVGSSNNQKIINSPVDARDSFVPQLLNRPATISGIVVNPGPNVTNIGNKLGTEAASLVSNNIMDLKNNAPEYDLGSTQGILPSIVGGLGSIAGNYIMSKGVKPVTLDKTYSPEQISLAKERAVLNRQAREAGNVAMQNLRTTGNRGAYIGGVGTAITGLNKGLADATTGSFQREALTNLEQRNRVQAMNAEVDRYNAMMRAQANQDKQAYKSAMIKAVPEAITDVNKIQQQNAMLNTLASQYYGVKPGTAKYKDLLFGRQLKGTVKK